MPSKKLERTPRTSKFKQRHFDSGNASAFPEGCKIEEIWRFLRSNRVNRVSSELCWSSGERSQPGSHLMKLPASSSFSKIEIHRPPGCEICPDLQPANSTQHNANTGNDFRRRRRSETLSPGEQRDVAARPADHIPAPISPTTFAPLGLSHRPGLSSVRTAEDVRKHTVATGKQFWKKRNMTAE